MQHVDAKLVREHLNAIALAISSLERQSAADPKNHLIATRAQEALREVAKLVTMDEIRQSRRAPPQCHIG